MKQYFEMSFENKSLCFNKNKFLCIHISTIYLYIIDIYIIFHNVIYIFFCIYNSYILMII